MADHSFSLAKLSTAIQAFNEERDWAQYHCQRNLAMALSVEVGELMALYLWSKDDGPQPPVAGRAAAVRHELADVAICLINLANQAEVDLGQAVLDKLAVNAEKYPVDKARGRMEKSTEL